MADSCPICGQELLVEDRTRTASSTLKLLRCNNCRWLEGDPKPEFSDVFKRGFKTGEERLAEKIMEMLKRRGVEYPFPGQYTPIEAMLKMLEKLDIK